MSRLTYEKLCEILQSVDQVTFSLTRVGEETHSSREVYEAIKELQHYKDLEEQGRLITLPCKVGEEAWCIKNETVQSLIFDFEWLGYYDPEELFATEEEAEAKLAELKGVTYEQIDHE